MLEKKAIEHVVDGSKKRKVNDDDKENPKLSRENKTGKSNLFYTVNHKII